MKITKKYIWDYNIEPKNLSTAATKQWYLSRMVNFGNWAAINSRQLKKHLSKLDIDSTLKKMLKNYYAHKNTTTRS